RRGLVDSHRAEHVDDVQRRVRSIPERLLRSAPDLASRRGGLHGGFRALAVLSELLDHDRAAGGRGPCIRYVLLAYSDVRADRGAETADHLWNRGVCGGYRVREQLRIHARGLVRGNSLLALDLLDRGGAHAADDDLRLFRYPVAAASGATPEL